MKVIIAGGRDLHDHNLVTAAMNKFALDGHVVTEVVSGGAKGIDLLGERWAVGHGLPVRVFPADWGKYGRAAGPRRNETMAFYADFLVAVWDGESTGTKHMIATMFALKKGVLIWRVPPSGA